MNIETFKEKVTSKEMGCEVHYHEEVTSTNIVAKELAGLNKPSGTLIVADFQSQGKGRRGRTWVAPRDKDIFMSLLLRPQIKPTQASMLTLVMGLSVAQAVNEQLGINSQIKWPNDVVVGGKKICGILTEMSANTGNASYVIIGTGINCNTTEFTDIVLQDATSLAMVTGHEVSREVLLSEVLVRFETNYHLFLQTKDMTALIGSYNSILVNAGHDVKVCGEGEEWIGRAKGINEQGELLVEDSDGKVRQIFTGEVSVRGIYGYV